jgi:hypothetical protein
VISPTYRPKLKAQKPVISSIPVLRAELHVSAETVEKPKKGIL